MFYELAVSTSPGRVTERKRLSRSQFERFWSDRPPCRVVMEACGGSHYWRRQLRALGFEVVLMPPHYVRAYVRRNKTGRTDCETLLEALRCAALHTAAIKSEDQQAIAALHRLRSAWMTTRTARINALRGLLSEFGSPTTARLFTFLALRFSDHSQPPASQIRIRTERKPGTARRPSIRDGSEITLQIGSPAERDGRTRRRSVNGGIECHTSGGNNVTLGR